MKFLCDRCKTRYSIGDDRVRGKILKIRCKNCANVITVREGMTLDGEGPPVDEARSRKPAAAAAETREAPDAPRARDARDAPDARDAVASREDARPAPAAARPGAARDPLAGLSSKRSTEIDTVRALGRSNVRASATPPRGEVDAPEATAAPAPAALEEEWYVSVDGEQAGPFSLTEAQRWVTQQPLDAELHCWSEGFDDWLPVDKVSHFRGLRKRPLSTSTPPPVPRATAGAARPAAAEEDPKPLFAATMASLERDAAAMPAGLGMPATAAPAARATSLGEAPIATRAEPGRTTNGAQGLATPLGARGEVRSDARDARPEPAAEATPAANSRTPAGKLGAREAPAARPAGKLGAREAPATAPAGKLGAQAATPAGKLGAQAATPAGKLGAQDRAPDAPGAAADRQPFGDPFDLSEGSSGEPDGTDGKTVLEAMPFDDAPVEPRRGSAPALGGAAHGAAGTAPPRSDFGSDDDLDIGEVSRVVNLADLSRGGRPDHPAPRRAPTAPAVATRASGMQPSLRPSTRSTAASTSLPPEPEPGMASAPVARAQRRGLIALLVVAGVLVLGVVGAVLLFVTRDDEAPGTSLGTVQDIDTSRPDNPVAHRPVGSAGSASVAVPAPPAPVAPRPHTRSTPGTGQIAETPAGGSALGGDEIEDVARKHQEMTQRCYMRSQRGADSILVGDVKKIAVTLTIDREGNVSDLQLSDHAADTLGKCLSGAIRTWKFRPSSGGTFRFSLNFVDG